MSQVDAKSLQIHGQNEYRCANFRGALDAFTKASHTHAAFNMGEGDSIGILDNRAATHCKLGSLNSALQDARRMVKENKMDARGYLRTAKILQLMDKHESALQTYHYALRVLPQGSDGRQQIKDLSAKLDKRLNGPKLSDPFDVLPLELVSMVLEHLDLRSLLSTVRVSKRWNRLLNSIPRLWTHLDLTKARRRNVSLKAIQAFLRRSHWRLSRASLTNLQPDDFPKLMTGLKRIGSLEHLDLQGSFSLRFNVAPIYGLTKLKTLVCSEQSEMTFGHFSKVLSDCPLLQRVEVHVKDAPLNQYKQFPNKLPNLRALTIVGFDDNINGEFLSPLGLPFLKEATLFDITPNLEELYLIYKAAYMMRDAPKVSNLPKLKRFGLLGMKLNHFPELPKSLERLSLSRSISNSQPGQHISKEVLAEMAPNLKALILDRFRDDELGPFLIAFTQSKSSLTHLDLEGCHLHVEDLLIAMMRGNLENITTLNIAGLAEIGERVIANILDMIPKIKELDISRTRVKEHSVKRLIESDKVRIEKLVVHNMETPFSREFLTFARSKGIEVPPPINRDGAGNRPPTEPRR
ncbi:hypothetical protein PABG_01139 [Paracoccidioides brasiliensis Pb03]|nr:hypothetical protein PABG_01139 [Paracoccidioides brasiliensis Pb03]